MPLLGRTVQSWLIAVEHAALTCSEGTGRQLASGSKLYGLLFSMRTTYIGCGSKEPRWSRILSTKQMLRGRGISEELKYHNSCTIDDVYEATMIITII